MCWRGEVKLLSEKNWPVWKFFWEANVFPNAAEFSSSKENSSCLSSLKQQTDGHYSEID